jgi:hypothetical protein
MLMGFPAFVNGKPGITAPETLVLGGDGTFGGNSKMMVWMAIFKRS